MRPRLLWKSTSRPEKIKGVMSVPEERHASSSGMWTSPQNLGPTRIIRTLVESSCSKILTSIAHELEWEVPACPLVVLGLGVPSMFTWAHQCWGDGSPRKKCRSSGDRGFSTLYSELCLPWLDQTRIPEVDTEQPTR